ncbi:MAG: hypothetical protein KDK36_00430, partial [Leptospiraceae bacterium]|nr:hypothetical protein [Leptospiraceae bacterium]
LHDDDIGSLEWEFGDAFKAPTKPLNLDKPIDSIPKIINYKKDKKELVDKLTKYSKDLEKDEEYILPDKKKEKDKKWFWEKYR